MPAEGIFKRLNILDNTTLTANEKSCEAEELQIYHLSAASSLSDEDKDADTNNNSNTYSQINSNKMQRRYDQTVNAVQLTSLWEHVLRTRRLPTTICPAAVYAEFHERLQDPEWQVRQHALRVLVDVLAVMRSKADMHSMHFLIDLIKNLGHQAPTVRKGALDCLRVYLTETDVPDMVMTQILDTGLCQQPIFDDRLSCGVLLSLPPLLQSIMSKPQRHFIVKNVIERLVHLLQRQQTQQEIILKVLKKLSEVLGVKTFESYLGEMEDLDGLLLYNQLCNVYGISNKQSRAESSVTGAYAGAWRALSREHTWRTNNPVLRQSKEISLPENGKVIMETEIQINDDTLTMRIVEADTETEETEQTTSSAIELDCHPLVNVKQRRQMDAGVLQVISDSEVEDIAQYESTVGTPFRGLKRVTFGGEVVKMRTPDSDGTSSTQNGERNIAELNAFNANIMSSREENPLALQQLEVEQADAKLYQEKNNKLLALTLEIPNDNTKPLPRARSAQPLLRSNTASNEEITQDVICKSPRGYPKNIETASSVNRSRSISPPVSITPSPKVPHKEIEVLHNLQREPDTSPRSTRKEYTSSNLVSNSSIVSSVPAKPLTSPKSWEDLDIVNYKTIMDLRSGDWRNRLQGVGQLEMALSSSVNLALVQPYLDSLLRTLLSSERNFDVAEVKREILINLISRLPLDNLEERTLQILSGLCRQGNAGANRVCKALMQRLPAGSIVAKLTAPDYLHSKSSRFRDHALQMSIHSLMSFPGTCFDIHILASQVACAALNRKRRVRQAAMEVFAVLADISSVEQVLEIVNETANNIELGPALISAVKTRLARLQLPIILTDGSVLYTFQQTDQRGLFRFGADIDWINAGEGSASPNAIKRRRLHLAQKKSTVQDSSKAGATTNYRLLDDNLHRHSFHSPPETLNIFRNSNDSLQRKAGKYELKVDGRSPDSTTTSCSSGSGTGIGSDKRLVRQHSRFPVMSRQTNFIKNYMCNPQGTARAYNFQDNDDPTIEHPASETQKHPQIFKRTHSTVERNSTGDTNDSRVIPKLKESEREDFCHILQSKATSVVNMSKWKVQEKPTNQFSSAAAEQHFTVTSRPQECNNNGEGSPLSIKSTSYSQKSTASAKSCSLEDSVGKLAPVHSATDGDIGLSNIEQQFGELVVDDLDVDAELNNEANILKRNESVNSLQSKTESIKTQIEDTTPQISRAQSIKSLPIEEEIEDSNSFFVVEDLQNEFQSASEEMPKPAKNLLSEPDPDVPSETLLASLSRISPTKSEIDHDRTMHSRSISLDSLYGRRPPSKQGSLDMSTSTTDNSSNIGSHFNSCRMPSKVQHTPLKQKSKTHYFLRGQRRVSPVKQTIKMSQTELFPSNMSGFEKPREALMKTFDQLDSNNWEINMTGLKSMVRLIRYHADLLDSHMHMTCIQLSRSVRNLRSQVARASCQAATELFTLKCKSLELECDDLVCALLHRTADTNRFLRADATRALESMVDHVQPPKILNILTSKGAQHPNALVRTTTAKLMFRLVERLGCDRIYSMGRESRDKFFVVGANLLLEGSLETRSYAKSLFRALSEHGSYQRLLLEVIPPRTYRNVEKTLRNITR